MIALVSLKLKVKQLPNVGMGPKAAITTLAASMAGHGQFFAWIENPRIEALCGGSQRSLREAAGVLRCWASFAINVLGKGRAEDLLPASADGLVAWSRVFAVKETYRNYLGKLRLACEILRVSTACFEHPSIKRAKSTIKRLAAAPRKKQHTRRLLVGKLITLAKKEGDLARAPPSITVAVSGMRMRMPENRVLPRGLMMCFSQHFAKQRDFQQ